MAPDGKRFVYRSFGPDGDGLRIMNLETKAVTTLTSGYDNFPLWSPRGDLIMFSRAGRRATTRSTPIKPDGTGVKRLTIARGNDAHMAWSPDGEHIVVRVVAHGIQGRDDLHRRAAAVRRAVRDALRRHRRSQQLTDNQWEDGTPAWQPVRRPPSDR